MPADRVHFRAGFASADITPDPSWSPVELSGYVDREQPALGVRERLEADALALAGDEQDPVVIVGLDLCILGEDQVAKIAAACPVPRQRLVLCCSHTHSAVATYPLVGCGQVSDAYLRHLALVVGDTVRRAMAEAVPCRLGWGRATLPEPPWANRRDPSGPIDPRIHLLKIERAESTRTPICALWSLACHPVVLEATNRYISPDWVGMVRRALPMPSLFTQGFCGEQNPAACGEGAVAVWGAIATALEALWSRTPTAPSGPLGWRDNLVQLPRATGDPVGEWPQQTRAGAAMRLWVEQIARPGQAVPPSPAEVRAARIGNGRVVFWPGEPHIPYALELPADCLPVGHTGPTVGYIPEEAAYARGGYEVQGAHRYYAYPSGLAPEAGKGLREATTALLAALG